MSYNCTISFKKIGLKDIYKFLQEYKKFIIENLNKIVEDEYMWCPSVKNRIGKIDYKELTANEIDLDENWFCRIFKHRFFYDDEFGLLGIYGVPTVSRKLFDKTVYFQNSCDQDYGFEDWEGIPEFENIYNKCMQLTAEELKAKKDYIDDDYIKEEDEEGLNYYRRSFAYDKIWERYEWSLWNDNDVIYLSLFNLWDDLMLAKEFTINCYNLRNKSWDELDKKEKGN